MSNFLVAIGLLGVLLLIAGSFLKEIWPALVGLLFVALAVAVPRLTGQIAVRPAPPSRFPPRNAIALGLLLMAASVVLEPAAIDRRPDSPVVAALFVIGILLVGQGLLNWIFRTLR